MSEVQPPVILVMARLDRLSPAKEVAQQAAVLGREFSYSLLAAVAELIGACGLRPSIAAAYIPV